MHESGITLDNLAIKHLQDLYGLNPGIPHLAQQFPRLPPGLNHPMFKIYENPLKEQFSQQTATINQKLHGFQQMYQEYAAGLLSMRSSVVPPGHPLYSRQNSVETLQAENDKLQKENSESKWNSISDLQNDVGIVALPYTAENTSEMAATGRMFASHSHSDAPNDLPLSSFEALATQLYRALSRSAAAAIEFYAVSSVSASVESDDETMPGPKAFAKDDGVGETDDVYNDDASSELENEAPVEDDDISVETESIDGTEPAPLDVPNESARQMMLSELTGASRRILLECERRMGDLEAKQDEFLLNSDQGMPILEFGSDAQAIIYYAAASFEEKAEDATGTAEIDDSIQAQIEGEKET